MLVRANLRAVRAKTRTGLPAGPAFLRRWSRIFWDLLFIRPLDALILDQKRDVEHKGGLLFH